MGATAGAQTTTVVRRRLTAALAAIVALGLGPTIGPPPAAALTPTVTVDCAAETDDIGAIQSAIDTAADDDVIGLLGTCEFDAAPAHGGDTTGIAAAAVVIRPASAGAVTGLTITSAGDPRSATVRGGGDEAAFAILPGNDHVTIRGLRFEALARPVVALGTSGTTVEDNRIGGDQNADSAILAVASGDPATVAYGPDPESASPPAASVTPATLTGFTVHGNDITYTPPSAAPSGDTDIVGVDVRQEAGGTVSAVTITGNSIAMFGSEFATFRHNGIRVQGLEAVPASDPPATGDYRITDVTIDGNNLGRFEDLDSGDVPGGVDPSDTHAAGRAGIVLMRVGTFEVTGNNVRARLSATGGVDTPGGGILVSDSSFGSIDGDNRTVVVLADVVPESSDLGAIGILEGLPRLLGDPASDQATTGVEVTDNVIGALSGANIETQRGIVLTGGVEEVTVWDNDVRTRAAGLYVGAEVRRGVEVLTTEVDTSVLCDNVLDGGDDDPAEVSFSGGASSAGNAFPGGDSTDVQDVAPDNGACTPTLSVSPSTVTASDALQTSGRAWGARPVSVAVTDETGATVTASGTATVFGEYAISLSPTDLDPLADGRLEVIATASDAGGLSRDSTTAQATKNFVSDPPSPGTASIDDGDGWINAEEVVLQSVEGSWTASADQVSRTLAWWSDDLGNIPSKCGPFPVSESGTLTLSRSCGEKLPEGTVRFTVRWEASDGDHSDASATSVKDTQVDTPTITSPSEGEQFSTTTIDVSGSATEGGSEITVTEEQPNGQFTAIATVTADSTGAWTAGGLSFDDGSHRISAYVHDPAGNRSTSTSPISFEVDTGTDDTTAPNAPIINGPLEGDLLRGRFGVAGTAEPDSTVRVFANGVLAGQATTKTDGTWATGVNLSTGSWTLDADATDQAGNTSSLSSSVTVDVDADKPGLSVITPDETTFGPGTDVVIEGTASDNLEVSRVALEFVVAGDGNQVILSGDATLTCSTTACADVAWEFEADGLPPGVYDVTIGAVDPVVNFTLDQIRIVNLTA